MKKIHLIIFIIATVMLQSCFEIVEQVSMRNDGSGSFTLTLNMSKSKTKISSIMKLKNINGHPVPTKQEINAKATTIFAILSKSDGITNANKKIDFDNFICTVSCNFASIAQLNKAIKAIKKQEGAKGDALEDDFLYDAKQKTFTQNNKYPIKELYAKMTNADKEIFSTTNFTSIFKFENAVTAVSNKAAKISQSKKAVMINQSALNIIKEKTSIENKINISK